MHILAGLTIFLSAFLLFQVQPLIGKYILPWFGGTPAVWTTCMLFFQILLLGGYAYAHLVVSRLAANRQRWVHVVLLAAALAALPIVPAERWKQWTGDNPTWQILMLLAVTVGGPYLLLSTTGPLIQGWYGRAYPGRSPYRLYALSNVGSLLGLVSYPFLFEPLLRVKTQAWLWSAGYAAFALLCAVSAWGLTRMAAARQSPESTGPAAVDEAAGAPRPALSDVLLWVALAACGSVMLLATTNQMCQNVAVVPFLWIVPLCLYLITFILCFESDRWYVRYRFLMALIVAMGAACVVLYQWPPAGTVDQFLEDAWGGRFRWLAHVLPSRLVSEIAAYSLAMFVCCMCCHGELAGMKPHPRRLTFYYLTISAGGALGGVFVTLVAPRIFSGYWEYHTGLAATCVLMLLVAGRDHIRDRRRRPAAQTPLALRVLRTTTGVAALGAMIALTYLLVRHIRLARQDAVAVVRNFYGALRVVDNRAEDPVDRLLMLRHGNILHGVQFQVALKREWPTAYYLPESGIGITLRNHPRRDELDGALRIGVVGLGTGTIAVYAEPGDRVFFYEINPAVIDLCRRYFTYCEDAVKRGAGVWFLPGDARIVMERQLAGGQSAEFDVLAVDAFSGDAIPVHLLTRECFDIYWRHLRPDGVLVLHISNSYLDLAPVVRELADVFGKRVCLVNAYNDPPRTGKRNQWIIVTDNEEFLEMLGDERACSPWPPREGRPVLWTDDYSSLYPLLR